MSNAKHTPGRMEYGHVGLERFWIGTSHDATPIACVLIDDDDLAGARGNARDNAARIVRAWNCHDELLEALESAVSHIRGGISENGLQLFEFEYAKELAVIAKAKGE